MEVGAWAPLEVGARGLNLRSAVFLCGKSGDRHPLCRLCCGSSCDPFHLDRLWLRRNKSIHASLVVEKEAQDSCVSFEVGSRRTIRIEPSRSLSASV